MMKIYNFLGDLTDISAKKGPLRAAGSERSIQTSALRRQFSVYDFFYLKIYIWWGDYPMSFEMCRDCYAGDMH